MKLGSGRGGLAAVAMFLGGMPGGGDAGAQVISASASTGYGSGNTGYGGTVISGYSLPATGNTPNVGLSAGLLGADGDAQSKMPIGALGVYGTSFGASNYPTDPRNYYVSGGGSINYNDTITVFSSSLPAGTPVSVHFSIEIAYGSGATHSIGTSKGPNQTQNYGFYLMGVGGGASDNFGLGGFYMDSNLNKKYYSTASASGDKLGIFNGTPHADFDMNTQVGHTINFGLTIQASAFLTVASSSATGFGPLLNQSGSSAATLGAAFGATANNPAVVLKSAVMKGAAFPDSSMASAPNAAAVVPEPATMAVFAGVGLLGFAGLWRRRGVRR